MEITLDKHNFSLVNVCCDGRLSHSFDWHALILKNEQDLFDQPITYGKKLYNALFPSGSQAQIAHSKGIDRLLLTTTDSALDAIPWEYIYGPDGLLVLECHFLRGLPPEQRIPPPVLDSGLHIVAIPSNPLDQNVLPLNVEGEWVRLKEVIREVHSGLTLERACPATLEQVRRLVANQRHLVLHFMGHGGQSETEAILCFEKENGTLEPVTAKQFSLRVRNATFLVTLNACVSAAPGKTVFSNLAASIVRQKTPYALGMRFRIYDEDARTFSRIFYSELAHGSSVEEALLQARLVLAEGSHGWSVGVPVLYTALTAPAAGFVARAGTPTFEEHPSRLEVNMLSRAEGNFQGRVEELKALGNCLTGDSRYSITTIHGGGGQGKTVLAYEAVKRFAFAWPGGVWATTLENLPSRTVFVNDLARFLGLVIAGESDPIEVEKQVLARLSEQRMLIVLDNAETLVEAVEADNEDARQLAQFIREQLPHPPVSLLVTSRSFLGWAGETGIELSGLSPHEGAELFKQHTPQRLECIDSATIREISCKVGGHPLSLRLLGSAFNASNASLLAFVEEYETQLLMVENKYKDIDHRHRTLYASIETSLRYLDADLRALLSGLWVFHAPFVAETAIAIFDPETEKTENATSSVRHQLHTLWQRGLLTCRPVDIQGDFLLFYYLQPTTRPYVKKHLGHIYEEEKLLSQFGNACAGLVNLIAIGIHHKATLVYIARTTSEDLERGIAHVSGKEKGYLLLQLGHILEHLGEAQKALKLTEWALEIAQGQDRHLEEEALCRIADIHYHVGRPYRALELYEQARNLLKEGSKPSEEAYVLNSMALVYQHIGQPQRALELLNQAQFITSNESPQVYEVVALSNMAAIYYSIGQTEQALDLYKKTLPLIQEEGNRMQEAAALNNMAGIYRDTGRPQEALVLYSQSVTIHQEMDNRRGEASALMNMAGAYVSIGQLQRAMELYEQALPVARETNNRKGEAVTLSNIAGVHLRMGQIQSAVSLYEQALPIFREVDDRAGEAATSSNMGDIYLHSNQLEKALEIYEQALSTQRQIGDYSGEAGTCHNIAEVYGLTGRFSEALEMYEQALSIRRMVGDRVGMASTLHSIAAIYRFLHQPRQSVEMYEQALKALEGTGEHEGEISTLNNMASLYRSLGELDLCLQLYQQSLSIAQEVGDQEGEITIINNMAGIYHILGWTQRALELLERALYLCRLIEDWAREAATLKNIALTLSESPNRSHEAPMVLQQAMEALVHTGLSHDASGQTVDDLQRMQQDISSDASTRAMPLLSITNMPPTQIQQIINNTVSVMIHVQDRRAEWSEIIEAALNEARQEVHWRIEADFFSAILDIISMRSLTLPDGHPYSPAIAAIQGGITMGIVPKESIIGETMYGVDILQFIVARTCSALDSPIGQRSEWRDVLMQIRQQAIKREVNELVAIVEAAISLLDADGIPSGLGEGLTDAYAKAWDEILIYLASHHE